jgi:hypothetical protein
MDDYKIDDDTILIQLEELAVRLGMTVRYVHMGGFCRIKGKDFLIINKKATPREKIYIFIDALKRRDLSEIYVRPSLRQILDNQNDQ